MSSSPRDVWITGIGLISSLGEGLDAHWQAMALDPAPTPKVEAERFAPFPVLPMVPLELDKQIPRKADQRQMEPGSAWGPMRQVSPFRMPVSPAILSGSPRWT